MNSTEFKSLIVNEEELTKRQNCAWLKGCKLFNQSVRTDANKQIMINRNGEVIGAKESPNDSKPGIFHDRQNGYNYIRLHDKGMIALHIAMKFVFYDEIQSPYDEPTVDDVVDHINGVKDDNKLSNLRVVSKQFNSHNHVKCKKNVRELPSTAKLTENNDCKLKCYSDDDSLYVELRTGLYYKTPLKTKLPNWLCRQRI